jgi:hypothetical protein
VARLNRILSVDTPAFAGTPVTYNRPGMRCGSIG